MRRSTALILAIATTAACSAAASGDDNLVVDTDHGPVRGADHGGYVSYQGIPYAAPPIGERRWTPPQPNDTWTDVRDATKPGNQCAQAKLDGSPGVQGDEDCLYLNVTRPDIDGKKPVMVWLHGGGFTNGSGNDYDGNWLAAKGAVVVTVNYRLGAFGFLGHPELGDQGDFGLADQAAALRWVRANAAAFGGDPGNVTLFGESAGAMSVCSHLTSPESEGLFDKAIIESGSCMTEYPKNGVAPGVPVYRSWWPKEQVQGIGVATAQQLGCTDLACLRGKKTEELATGDIMARFSFQSYGVKTLPEDPVVALKAGRFQKVPVLQGSNHDEMRFYVGPALAGGLKIDQAKYDELVTDSFGADADKVKATYPTGNADTWATVLTDAGWSCTTLEADKAMQPLHAYEFADPNAPNFQKIPTVDGFPFGAAHGTELAYLFPFPGVEFTAEQKQLSDTMLDAWTRFARDGDPGWEKFPYVQQFKPGAVGRTDLAADHHCELWETV